MYDNDYVEEKETRHHQLRWVITTEVGGVVREQEFAHPLAAQDALVIAGEHRASGVHPHETLRRLRMLAYESLEAAKQLAPGELLELRVIHARLEGRDQRDRNEIASDSADGAAVAGDGVPEDDTGVTEDADGEEQE